ncbi:MAG TPA: hypothetical protein PKD49_11520 [Hyphomicrobium sp.]|nr:hypothetical protein [Hyphomicrobium sp.]
MPDDHIVQVGVETQSRFLGLQAAAPALIGLMAPALVLFIVDPRALGSVNVLLHIYLGAIFVIATGAYILSVLDPGYVTRISLDKKTRTITIERTGLLARKAFDIPFSDVASLRTDTRYDDDGYRSDVALLVLSNREAIELPATTSEADLAAMRAALGRC